MIAFESVVKMKMKIKNLIAPIFETFTQIQKSKSIRLPNQVTNSYNIIEIFRSIGVYGMFENIIYPDKLKNETVR